MSRTVPSSLLVLIAASPSFAMAIDPIDWVTDIRRCTASFSGNGSGSSWQDRPVAFGGYEDGGAEILVSNGVETWSADCLQESQLEDAGASFAASSRAAIVAGLLSNPLLSQAQSKFDVYFTIAETTSYRMEGHVAEGSHADSMAVVRLTRVGGNEVTSVVSAPDSSRSFDITGELAPGTYRLYAESLGKCRTLPTVLVAEGHASCRVLFSLHAAPPQQPEVPERPKTTSSTDTPPPAPQRP